ncbi:phosphatase PAP2 family protein [Microbacterium aurantiacum]|uniref:phosphatase PAP2 family protein n=1 Tax=Microbacterium aurantiacum TaxID=162393 RepID=UPI001FE62AB3|nr:phosphatase PAP2 family protein [Microbacterium aurantiacum]
MNRRMLLWWGVSCLLAATALGSIVVLGFGDTPAIDHWWNTVVIDQRAPWVIDFAHVLNFAGGSSGTIFVIAPLLIVGLLLTRRWRSAAFAVTAMVTSALAVQALKQLFGRARPADMLVASDYGSFPSGHVANAATIALVIWVIFPRVWTALLGALWVLGMAYSRTLLSVHWATDTLGGALTGAGAVLLVAALLSDWVQGRNPPSDPPIVWEAPRPS